MLWSQLHVDFVGPVQGQSFLIVVNSYSKLLEIIPVSSMMSCIVIKALCRLFVMHGLPHAIESDDGTQFTSEAFCTFLADGLICHIISAPFHPVTNGQAERMVRTTKEALKLLRVTGIITWQFFLLTHHTVHHYRQES